MTFIFPYIGKFIIPTDKLIFFIGVGLNHQPDYIDDMINYGLYRWIVYG